MAHQAQVGLRHATTLLRGSARNNATYKGAASSGPATKTLRPKVHSDCTQTENSSFPMARPG